MNVHVYKNWKRCMGFSDYIRNPSITNVFMKYSKNTCTLNEKVSKTACIF